MVAHEGLPASLALSIAVILSDMRSLLMVLTCSALYGQAPDLRFQHLTTNDGLSDNAITCVFEDGSSFIWVSIEHG